MAIHQVVVCAVIASGEDQKSPLFAAWITISCLVVVVVVVVVGGGGVVLVFELCDTRSVGWRAM